MRVAVLADVHGDLPALEAVLDEVERLNVDRIVLNGDIAGGHSIAASSAGRVVRARRPTAPREGRTPPRRRPRPTPASEHFSGGSSGPATASP